MVVCPHCQTSNRPLAKFCMKCVASLEAANPGSDGRASMQDARTTLYHHRTQALARDVGGQPEPLPPSFSEHALPEGTLIEGFRIVRPIGEGGFGIVYLAWDAALERQVAIKEYLPSSLVGRAVSSLDVTMRSQRFRETFDVGLKSFVNEARLLARFDHPALIKVFRFWEANRTAYMAMPYYEGPTLKDALAEMGRAVTERQLREWLDPLLDALAVIHRENCYHRDISPDNILLTATGPLLLDFGAARRVISDMTQALTAVLKPGFAPIEQYGGGLPQGPWTDLYALAGVVYYAITGRPPLASAVRAVNDTVQPLAVSHAGRYGATFLRAIDAALAVRPEGRPQDVSQFRALLQQGAAPAPAVRTPVPATLREPVLDDPAGPMPVPLDFAPTQVAPRSAPLVSLDPVAVAKTEPPLKTATEPVPQPALQPAPRPVPAKPPTQKQGAFRPIAGVAAVVVLLAAGGAWMFGGRDAPAAARPTALPTATATAATATVPAAAPAPLPAPAPAALSESAIAAPAIPATNLAPTLALPAAVSAPVAAEAAVPTAAPLRESPRRVAARMPDKPAVSAVARKAKASEAEPLALESKRQSAPESEVVSYNKEQPKPTRCTDMVLKSSLESLTPDETAFLKKYCR